MITISTRLGQILDCGSLHLMEAESATFTLADRAGRLEIESALVSQAPTPSPVEKVGPSSYRTEVLFDGEPHQYVIRGTGFTLRMSAYEMKGSMSEMQPRFRLDYTIFQGEPAGIE